MKYAVRLIKNTFHPLRVPEGKEVKDGDMVLVTTDKGEEAVKVFTVNSEISKQWEKSKVEELTLIKVLNENDLETLKKLKEEEIESLLKCQTLIAKHKLGMHLVQCRITFDRKKITFYYTAPERVDFRELLKDLTQIFKRIRIDLRHIGVRDETSIVEGCGICGKPFCCCGFLRKFETTNIKLAKDQGMPIAPGKISGTCGRLLCCLNYEYSNYIEAAKGMPPIGSSVMTPDGLGKVFSLQFLSSKISVKLEDGKTKEYTKQDIEMVDAEVNVEINLPNTNQYATGEKIDMKQLKQLEDDRNSSTGNV
ncbi:MAG: stage 0 sporulation protein [bacterium]|nr:stage 0 sporulation protein [bacterium]